LGAAAARRAAEAMRRLALRRFWRLSALLFWSVCRAYLASAPFGRRRFRPCARRRLRVARPPLVFIRARKPCWRTRVRFERCKVRFIRKGARRLGGTHDLSTSCWMNLVVRGGGQVPGPLAAHRNGPELRDFLSLRSPFALSARTLRRVRLACALSARTRRTLRLVCALGNGTLRTLRLLQERRNCDSASLRRV
jgi:hypothetical protein